MTERAFFYPSLNAFGGVLVVALTTEGTSVIKTDLARKINIPDELMMPL